VRIVAFDGRKVGCPKTREKEAAQQHLGQSYLVSLKALPGCQIGLAALFIADANQDVSGPYYWDLALEPVSLKGLTGRDG